MSFDYKNVPTGFYTTAQIVKCAEACFPDAYDALIDHHQLSWEDIKISGVSPKGLFIGYITVFGSAHKVVAGVSSDGAVQFFMDDGPIAARNHWALFQLNKNGRILRRILGARVFSSFKPYCSSTWCRRVSSME